MKNLSWSTGLEEGVVGEAASGLSGILRRVFLEYLNLPFWFKVKFRSGQKGEEREYSKDQIHLLWRDLLGPYYTGLIDLDALKSPKLKVGQTVTLREMQLTNFVPRAPGKIHSEGFDSWKKLFSGRKLTLLKEAPPQLFLITAAKATELAMNATNMNDVTALFPAVRKDVSPLWKVYLKSKSRVVSVTVDARTGESQVDYDSSTLDEKFIENLKEEDLHVQSGYAGVVRFKRHQDLQLLTAFPPPTRSEDGIFYTGIESCLPVMMSSGAYDKIQGTIEDYGAVFLEEIRGIVQEIPQEILRQRKGAPSLEWGTGIPRVALGVESRLLLKHPGTPDTGSAYAWTAVQHKSIPYYCTGAFRIGRRDYEARIKEAVNEMRMELDTLEGDPLFDFDECRPRFSKAKYGPNYFLKEAGVLD